VRRRRREKSSNRAKNRNFHLGDPVVPHLAFINHFDTRRRVLQSVAVRASLALFHLFFDNVDLATFLLPVFDTPVPGTFQKMILAAPRGPSGDVPSDMFHFKGVSPLVRTS